MLKVVADETYPIFLHGGVLGRGLMHVIQYTHSHKDNLKVNPVQYQQVPV